MDSDDWNVVKARKSSGSKPPPKKHDDKKLIPTKDEDRDDMTEGDAQRVEFWASKYEGGEYDPKDMSGFAKRFRAAVKKRNTVAGGIETEDAENSLAAGSSTSNQSNVPTDIADGSGNSRGNSVRGRGGSRGGRGQGGRGGSRGSQGRGGRGGSRGGQSQGGRGGSTGSGSRSRSRGGGGRRLRGGRGESSERGSHGN